MPREGADYSDNETSRATKSNNNKKIFIQKFFIRWLFFRKKKHKNKVKIASNKT